MDQCDEDSEPHWNRLLQKNSILQHVLIYLGSRKGFLQNHSAMAALTKTNPIPFITNFNCQNHLYDAKNARCPKFSPADFHTIFPPGSTFQPKLNAKAISLSFINTLRTRSEYSLPILMENNKNHQITLPKGWNGFSSLDVVNRDEPKYETQNPYELTNAIISTNER